MKSFEGSFEPVEHFQSRQRGGDKTITISAANIDAETAYAADVGDPLAPERVLATLAFTALVNDVNYEDRRQADATILLDSGKIAASQWPVYQRVLGARRRRTGYLAEGREASEILRVPLLRAAGRIEDTLKQVETLKTPFPDPLAREEWGDEQAS